MVHTNSAGIMKGSENRYDWYRLDNAAKIYPPVLSDELTSVFRLSCTLKKPVKIGALREAVAITSKRFPYFNTTLRRGFFWYYLEYSGTVPSVSGEENQPLTGFPVSSVSESMYRILARGNKISVEFIHIITDGGGAMEYLRTLLVTYLRLTGNVIDYSCGIIEPSSEIDSAETEDAFNRYYKKEIPKAKDISKAWNLPYPLARPARITTTEAEISVTDIKTVAKNEGVSITEYMAATYLYAMQEAYFDHNQMSLGGKHKIIRLEIPINMRNLLPSRTMRNFALFVMPELDLRLGRYTFEEVLRIVYHYMQTETDTKLIYRIITRNVKPERNLLIRIMPLFIKDIVLSFAYKKHGPTKYTSVLTNLGVVKMPEGCEDIIDAFSVIPPPPNRCLKVGCGLISYGDKMRMTFTNLTKSLDLERRVLSSLVSRGVAVKIINNRLNHD